MCLVCLSLAKRGEFARMRGEKGARTKKKTQQVDVRTPLRHKRKVQESCGGVGLDRFECILTGGIVQI